MRKPIAPADAEAVLVRSRRRCCICFGLHRDVGVKKGQIAHLDQDNSNSSIENLAFLCFEHHDEYDSTTRLSKSFSVREAKHYRDELHQQIIPLLESKQVALPHEFETDKLKTIRLAVVELLERSIPGIPPSHLALQLGIARHTLESILFPLVKAGVVRVDRKRGTTRQWYSLASALENRLVDAFVATLGPTVVDEVRHIRLRHHSLDAVVTTSDGVVYVVEIMLAGARLTREGIERRLSALRQAKAELRSANAREVVLVGVQGETERADDTWADIEADGVVIRYVDLSGHPATPAGSPSRSA